MIVVKVEMFMCLQLFMFTITLLWHRFLVQILFQMGKCPH